MGYLIFARFRGVGLPWFPVTLHTFPEGIARRVIHSLDKADWEYSAKEISTDQLLEFTKGEVH